MRRCWHREPKRWTALEDQDQWFLVTPSGQVTTGPRAEWWVKDMVYVLNRKLEAQEKVDASKH